MKNNILPFYKIFLRTISYGFKKLPGYFVYVVISLLLSGLNFLSIYIVQRLFDTISEMVTYNLWDSSGLNIIIITGIIFVLYNLVKEVHGYININYFMMFISKILKDMNAKAGRLGLIEFESLELYKNISMAIGGVHHAIKSTISLLNGVIFHLTFFISIGIYFFSIKPILVVLCFLFFIPKILSQIIKGSKLYNLQDKLVNIQREYNYYQKCLTDKEFVKETKTLRAVSYFLECYDKKLKIYNKEQLNTELKIALIDLFLSFITYIGYAGSFAILVYYLLQGDISIGVFASVYYSLNKLMDSMKDMVELFGSIYENITLAGKLYDFLDMPERTGKDISLPPLEKISMQDVSFIYPYAERSSLENVTLEIEKGTRVAIVGINGSGKTTLIKLLLGLIQPSKGKVMFNDINIDEVAPKYLYSKSSAVFQNYGRYKLSLKENIMLSDIYRKASNDDINNVIEKSGFNLNKKSFSYSMDTILSREFGGIDLSGGEWQRLAIARGLYKVSELIVLDEPTSAIDPIEEASVYNRFIEISKGKTAVIVTHRLGSVKSADRIIVMDKGRVIEDGSHSELIEKGGLYAKMFLSQAQWYRR